MNESDKKIDIKQDIIKNNKTSKVKFINVHLNPTSKFESSYGTTPLERQKACTQKDIANIFKTYT